MWIFSLISRTKNFLNSDEERTKAAVRMYGHVFNENGVLKNFPKFLGIHLHLHFNKNRTTEKILFCEFCQVFSEHLFYDHSLGTASEWRVLRKMVNRHPCYKKDMSRSRQLFQKTDIARGSISQKATLNFKKKEGNSRKKNPQNIPLKGFYF